MQLLEYLINEWMNKHMKELMQGRTGYRVPNVQVWSEVPAGNEGAGNYEGHGESAGKLEKVVQNLEIQVNLSSSKQMYNCWFCSGFDRSWQWKDKGWQLEIALPGGGFFKYLWFQQRPRISLNKPSQAIWNYYILSTRVIDLKVCLLWRDDVYNFVWHLNMGDKRTQI